MKKKNNAINLEMLNALILKLSNKKYTKKFKCILIKGLNKTPFSAGADLQEIKSLDKNDNIKKYHKKMNSLILLLNQLEIIIKNLL